MAVPIDVATGPGGPEPDVPLSVPGKAIEGRAALVDAVHSPFHPGQFSVCGARRSCFVLNVPQLEVGLMLATDGRQPIRP